MTCDGNCNSGGPCTCASGCGCSSGLPFYNQIPSVQESHTQVLNSQTFSTAVSVGLAFNIPACLGTITIVLPQTVKLQVGSYLWNAAYGYLEVVAFDKDTYQAIVKNHCNLGNASVGTQVPACTLFNVVDPPYAEELCPGDSVYVVTDFTTPALGADVWVALTSLKGITVGATVQIGSGSYVIQSIQGVDTIVVRNTGAGAVPGTVVHAKNTLGYCITPVTPYGDNPCSQTIASTGALLVCHGGVASPLTGTINQIPVCINSSTHEVQMQTLAIPTETCTYINTCCWTLVPGTTAYNLTVADSSIFATNDIIVIHFPAIEADRWVVTGVPDPTHININHIGAQTHSDIVAVDTHVCLADCCEQITYQIQQGLNLCNTVMSSAFQNFSETLTIADTSSILPGATFVGRYNEGLLINDTCNDYHVTITSLHGLSGYMPGLEGNWARTVFTPKYAAEIIPRAAALNPIVPLTLRAKIQEHTMGIGAGTEPCDPYTYYYYEDFAFSQTYIIPTGMKLHFKSVSEFTLVDYRNASVSSGCTPCCGALEIIAPYFQIDAIDTRTTYLAIAIQVNP